MRRNKKVTKPTGPGAAGRRGDRRLAQPNPAAALQRRQQRLLLLLISSALVVAVLTVYASLYGADAGFFNLDDGYYVFDNAQTRAGLTWPSVAWAFTAFHDGNWHPLTWISLQIDHDLYGLDAGGYHLTNALFHAANCVLLLLVLFWMTRALWPSALVAALFALHPLHVESVAWITERKDVLSTLFWLLTMLAYVRYARRPGLARYALVVLAFALGLMSKPMLVTLPFVLLLLDFWPLGRWRRQAAGAVDPSEVDCPPATLARLAIEKLPLLALAAAASVVTVMAQGVLAYSAELGALPLWQRILVAAQAYVGYLAKTFWPFGLAPLYTTPRDQFSIAAGIAALVFLMALTGVVLWLGRRRPYLTVGWLWFLGTLVPVCGIVQIGIHTMADRYTYVPHIGLFIALVWGLADLCAKRAAPALLAAGSAAVLVALYVLTYAQAYLWRDNLLIWEHAVAATRDNFGAHDNLGEALVSKGRIDEALPHYRRALELEPRYARPHYHMGMALQRKGKWAQAAECFAAALRIEPAMVKCQSELALCLMNLGQMEEALAPLTAVAQAQPDSAEAHYNLGTALMFRSRYEEAARSAGEALRLEPTLQEARKLLGQVFAVQGKLSEAEDQFRAALRGPAPEKRLDPTAAYYLAWTLASQAKNDAAREQYRQAVQASPRWPHEVIKEAWPLAADPDARRRNGALALLKAEVASQALPEDPLALDALAAALAELGRFSEAAAKARRALELAANLGAGASRQRLLDALSERVRLYEQGQPFRFSRSAPPP